MVGVGKNYYFLSDFNYNPGKNCTFSQHIRQQTISISIYPLRTVNKSLDCQRSSPTTLTCQPWARHPQGLRREAFSTSANSKTTHLPFTSQTHSVSCPFVLDFGSGSVERENENTGIQREEGLWGAFKHWRDQTSLLNMLRPKIPQ